MQVSEGSPGASRLRRRARPAVVEREGREPRPDVEPQSNEPAAGLRAVIDDNSVAALASVVSPVSHGGEHAPAWSCRGSSGLASRSSGRSCRGSSGLASPFVRVLHEQTDPIAVERVPGGLLGKTVRGSKHGARVLRPELADERVEIGPLAGRETDAERGRGLRSDAGGAGHGGVSYYVTEPRRKLDRARTKPRRSSLGGPARGARALRHRIGRRGSGVSAASSLAPSARVGGIVVDPCPAYVRRDRRLGPCRGIFSLDVQHLSCLGGGFAAASSARIAYVSRVSSECMHKSLARRDSFR